MVKLYGVHKESATRLMPCVYTSFIICFLCGGVGGRWAQFIITEFITTKMLLLFAFQNDVVEVDVPDQQPTNDP